MMPKYKDRRINLQLRIGEDVAFNDESIGKINRFCRMLRELTDRNEVVWVTSELDQT